MDKKITIAQIKEVAQQAYDLYKTNTDGKNADYIPYLANINKNLFGISICLLNGQTIEVGDSEYRFGIESVSKVHTAILVLRQYGAKELLEKIGADATGLPFNSIIAILLENDHPSTPLVNAGAITACSMVKPVGDSKQKWDAIVANITDLCGSAPQLIDELYKSESATNFNNRSIAWLLKNYNRIYDDPDMSLDLYTRQCSLGITAKQLSVAAATVANLGLNPVTKKQVFDAELSPKITSMISTVGFYEHTGDWLYTSGIPAKTGVGGGVMGVLPGQFGISAFAPPIDQAGNSVKAQLAIKYVMNKLGLNVFNGLHTGDMATMDPDGTLYIRGRSKTMILSGNGQNIYPEEIEDKLNNMYLVLESLVLDAGNGKIKALVVPDYEQAEAEGVDKADLPQIMQNNLQELNAQLAAYERISGIALYPNEFEKTPKRSIKRYLYEPSLLNK